jgi:acyl-CoA dehydrogenase
MGTNEALKKEAVAAIEAGRLLAFGVSEKNHGSDILANEFSITPDSDGGYIANGSKYYIGNANCAAIISVLARRADQRRSARAPSCLVALRPDTISAWKPRKIDTLGVRAAFVGDFEVKEQSISKSDLIADGRDAWNAVLGTVSLGKFFLGFGSIGICEHAFEEAMQHMSARVLYGKPVIQMPHIRFMAAQAFARLTAMKIYAYRALDYVHAASAEDRRYLFYCAVQKAKVSTEGVKVMSLLLECVGAKGLESDTYFEMAVRDVQLIPGLESSMHINLVMAAQFGKTYFSRTAAEVSDPGSLVTEEIPSVENDYLMHADIGHTNAVAFGHFLKAYRPLKAIRNVRKFVRQAKAFAKRIRRPSQENASDTRLALATGQCLAIIAYAELIAQSASRLSMPAEIISAIFHFLVGDLSAAAMAMISLPGMSSADRAFLRPMIVLPKTSDADWDFVVARMGRTPVKREP